MSSPIRRDEQEPQADSPRPMSAVFDKLRLERGQTICHAKKLDVAGLYHVSMQRQCGYGVGEFYLDDDDQREAFILKAIARLCLPGEDPNEMRREFRELLGEKLKEYRDSHDHLLIERMSEAIGARIEWLWPGYIAADKLTMLVGDPGIGKSLVALDLAARVTTGRPWPNEPEGASHRDPGSVLLLAEMDDSADTIRPRLTALGADLSRVHLLRTFMSAAGDTTLPVPFSVAGNLDMLEVGINKVPDCKLVIIDPLSVYVEGTQTRRDITKLLGNLIEVAVSRRVAILVVSHMNKGGLLQYDSQLNSRFFAAARTVWKLVGARENWQRRLLVPMKNNLDSDWLGMGLRIDSISEDYTPRLTWEPMPLEITVERSTFDTNKPKSISSRCTRRESACEWLRAQLINGARMAQELFSAAREEQIGEKLLRRALRELGCMTRKGPTGRYEWALPCESSSSDFCAKPTEILQIGHENRAAKQGKQGKQANLDFEPAHDGDGSHLENGRQLP